MIRLQIDEQDVAGGYASCVWENKLVASYTHIMLK